MNNKRNENLSEEYPSLQLAYEQIQNVLFGQEQYANHLDTKTGILIAVATSIILLNHKVTPRSNRTLGNKVLTKEVSGI